MNLILKIIVFIVVIINAHFTFSKSTTDLERNQSTFIFKAAGKTRTSPHSKTKFSIALVGSNRDTKKLLAYINKELAYKSIKSRKVLFFSYKQLNQIGNEDLVVFSSRVKLRASEIESKLLAVNYVVLKESKPYGIYFFNADNLKLKANHLKLKVENKQNQELYENASEIIDEQNDSLIKKDIDLNKNSETIESQFSEISEKTGIISFQKTVIIIGVLLFLIISVLLFLLYNISKKRKLNLIDLKGKNKQIIDSLNYAKTIQDAILPDSIFFSSSFKEHFVFFKPKDIVSGDFYWTEKHNGRLYFAVSDCTGHGVPGAFLSMICNHLLSKTIKEDNLIEPCEILDAVSEELETFFSKNEKKVHDGMDISLICLDESSNDIIFSGAHNPLVYIKNGELNSIVGDKQPVGACVYKKRFTQHVINKDMADSIYLFSDGFADQFGGPNYKKYSKKRLRKLLIDNQSLTMAEQYLKVKSEFFMWRGDNDQIDDVTLVGFKL